MLITPGGPSSRPYLAAPEFSRQGQGLLKALPCWQAFDKAKKINGRDTVPLRAGSSK